MGNVSKRHEMPQSGILKVELFDIWGIDFINLFPPSHNNLYILVAVDYISKWVEAIASPTNDLKGDNQVSLKEHIYKIWHTESSFE